MAKVKFNAKEFLLRRGEVLVMGVAGVFLLVMLFSGVSMWGSANPGKEVDALKSQTAQVYSKIEGGTPEPADLKKVEAPEWVVKPSVFKPAQLSAFPQARQPLFDPVAQPSTKRDNPVVLPIGPYQVDLTRSAMLGYDIIMNERGDALIAVLTTKTKAEYDKDKLKQAANTLADAARRKHKARQFLNQPQFQPQLQPGFGPPGLGPMGGPMGAPPGAPPGAMAGAFGGTGGYDQNAQRVESVVKYVPLDQIDQAVQKGNLPAFTVIPLRLVTVHAVVPYKRQIDEIRRALRLPKPPAPKVVKDPNSGREVVSNQAEIDQAEAEAKMWGPWYDGFEVQRRVTKVLPDGTVQVIQDWPEIRDPKDTSGNYPFEELYIDRIDSKKIADHLDEGYFPYFLKPAADMMLAMPLPQLAKDLNVKYPEVKLKDILNNIEKLKKANQKEIPPSELLKQLSKSRTKNDLYKPKTADNLEGFGIDPKQYGPVAGGMGMPPATGTPPGGMPARPGGPMRPGAGTPRPPEGYDPTGGTPVVNEVDNFLMRFVDCDVKPGYTYQYRIRLRMLNPNFGQNELVANPEFAKESYKTLYSKWLQLETPITVPPESYLYAEDVKTYRDRINATYPAEGRDATAETKAINKLLQVRDDQALVQVATWMEQVRAGDNTKREPVGGWVVADIPVSRGEYVGRKQIVRLPLWSSETQQYVLRELADKVVKGKHQPKGWVVDFSTQSVLVDFEGGRVKSRTTVSFDQKGNLVQGTSVRSLEEDAATELLIVRPDGKLVVRSSQLDDADAVRKDIITRWTDWVKEVEKHKDPSSMTGEVDPFAPKNP